MDLHQDVKDLGSARERFRQSQQKASAMKLLATTASVGLQEEIGYGYPPTSTVAGRPVNESAFVDFAVRQYSCVSKIVLGGQQNRWHAYQGLNNSGCRVVTPFADSDWVRHWLNAPESKLKGQSLYIDMMKKRFPELAALPSKYSWGLSPRNNLGRWVRRSQHNMRKNSIQKS